MRNAKHVKLVVSPKFTRKKLAIGKITSTAGPWVVDDAKIAVLAKSISEIGLRQPIWVVRRPGMGIQYTVIAGNHRLLACRQLGHRKVMAEIVPTSVARTYRQA